MPWSCRSHRVANASHKTCSSLRINAQRNSGRRPEWANQLLQQESPSLMGKGRPCPLPTFAKRGASAGGPLPCLSPRNLSFLICKVASMLSAGRRVFISQRGLKTTEVF